LTEEKISKLSSTLKIETTPQESRCHAFYRLIGFPVVSSDSKMYNPGFDIVKYNPTFTITQTDNNSSTLTRNRNITLSVKLDIANNSIDGFRNLSIKRETYTNQMSKIFALNNSVSAGVLSLSSGSYIRSFMAAFGDNSDALDVKPKPYKLETKNIVGGNLIDLSSYVDASGQTATSLIKDRFHYIKPFIVDPRIDFSVNPAKNKVAIPFVPSKTELKISEIDYVKRPLLEKVIRDRFSLNSTATLGTSDKSIIDYIKSIPAIKDENIVNQISSGDVYKLTEQQQFVKFLNIIRAMASKLVESQLALNQAQSRYYFLPIPSKNGPEGGLSYHSVFLNVPDNFRTSRDLAIIKSKINVTINQLNSLTSDASGSPDVGDFAFDSFKTTFSDETSEALGDVSAQSLEQLTSERDHYLTRACEALRTIEIIMGEYSGLGLCDIIAVMGALYIIPKEDLLGFLDEDAYERMKYALNVTTSKSTIDKTLESFTSSVKDFYTLMDKIYQDLHQNNNLP
jgi:hypothetical protein